jgi:hypothetical protein
MTCPRCHGRRRCGSHRRKAPGAAFAHPFTVKVRKADMRIIHQAAKEAGYKTASGWARHLVLSKCGIWDGGGYE